MQNALSAFIGFAVALLVLGPKSGYATIITLVAVDSGHYANNGGHSVSNQNYVSGRGTFVAELHNFLVFDLSGVTDTIIAAELRAYNPARAVEGDSGDGFQSAESTETYELFSVETSIAILTAGTGGTSAFADLADGTSYGTRVFSVADNGQLVSIALNASALADLNAATDHLTGRIQENCAIRRQTYLCPKRSSGSTQNVCRYSRNGPNQQRPML